MKWYRHIQSVPALAGLIFATGCVVDSPRYTSFGDPYAPRNAPSSVPRDATPVSYSRVQTQADYGLDETYEEPVWNTYQGAYGVEAVLLMTQNGEPERSILEFVAESNFPFDPTADEINYLFQEGVSSRVVVAMVERGEDVMEASGVAPQAELVNEGLTVGTVPAAAPPAPAHELLDSGIPNVRTDYYQELAPHGEWIFVSDYGWSWRPRVAVSTGAWRPYFDNGNWLHSDVGWYWQSDYSWGWLPFHYGRWSHHGRYGWIWHPGDVWGPAWVSWRVHSGHYGWAPLPYHSVYQPAFGFTYRGRRVGASFGFGLTSFHYSFVPRRYFGARGFHSRRIRGRAHYDCFYHSAVRHHYDYHHGRRAPVNHGIDVRDVERASGRQIQRAALRKGDLDVVRRPGSRTDRNQNSAVVYRPETPDGQGVRARVATPRSDKFAAVAADGTSVSRSASGRRSTASSTRAASVSPSARQASGTTPRAAASTRTASASRSPASRSVGGATRATGAPSARTSNTNASSRSASAQRSFASPSRSAAPRISVSPPSVDRSPSRSAVSNRSSAPRASNSIPVQSSVMGRSRQSTTRDISSPAANSSQSYRYGLNQGSLNAYRSSVASRNSGGNARSNVGSNARSTSPSRSRASSAGAPSSTPNRNASAAPRASSSANSPRRSSVNQRRSVVAPTTPSRSSVSARLTPPAARSASPTPRSASPSRATPRTTPSTNRSVAPSRSSGASSRSSTPSRSNAAPRPSTPSRSTSSPATRSQSGGFGSSSRSTATPSRATPSRGASSSRSR